MNRSQRARRIWLFAIVTVGLSKPCVSAVAPDPWSPEMRMGLENYYSKTGSEDLLSRQEVADLVVLFKSELTCVGDRLAPQDKMPAAFADMNLDADRFKMSPYSATQAFRFYVDQTHLNSLLAVAMQKTHALLPCLNGHEKPSARLIKHLDLLGYAGDVGLASENYPGGRDAFFKDVAKPKKTHP